MSSSVSDWHYRNVSSICFMKFSENQLGFSGLSGKPFKPFFWRQKSFFLSFCEKPFLAFFFSEVFKIAPKCPFQSLYIFVFVKNSWGRTLRPQPVEGKSLPHPPHMPHSGALQRSALHHATMSHTKNLHEKNSWLNIGSMSLTLITRGTFESVGIFQWLNHETEKSFFF